MAVQNVVSCWHKLHQSTSKWISYTVFCEVLCLIPKSEVLPAETLNFAPQVGWRHHQVRKEISCRKWPRHVTRLTRFWPAVCEGRTGHTCISVWTAKNTDDDLRARARGAGLLTYWLSDHNCHNLSFQRGSNTGIPTGRSNIPTLASHLMR